LAREDVALAAQQALARMKKPGPAALRAALINTIFPEFGVDEPRISENTCRTYMEKWGWKTGKYREWLPRRKIDVKFEDSGEGDTVSDETVIVDVSANIPPTTSPVKPSWDAPIPSPTRIPMNLPAYTSIHTMNASFPTSFGDVHNSPPPLISSPSTVYTESTMSMPDPNQFWSSGFSSWPPNLLSSGSPIPRLPQTPLHMQDSTLPSTAQFTTPRPQYAQQVRPHTGANSLEYLFPASAQTMGHRPGFNMGRTPSFVPPPSQTGLFSHDVSYPRQMTRPARNQQSGSPGGVSQGEFPS
jgi:hypothetical protein